MDSHVGGMTYARFFPSDWRTGCLVLNLEEEGLYIRCCAYMYDTGNPIPGNDVDAARMLHVQIQKYQKVMGSLIEKGKMIRGQGWIVNERVQEEIDKYRREHAARSVAAQAREAARKKQIQREIEAALKAKAAEKTPPGAPPHQPPHLPRGGSLGGTPYIPQGVVGEVTGKKDNEINGTNTTVVPQAYHGSGTNPESRSQKLEKKEDTTTGAECAAEGRGGGDYLNALNGTAVDLVAFISKHAGGIITEPEARRMLSTNIKAFGPDAMTEAYSLTVAEMAGGILGKPYKYLIETARRIKDGRAVRAAKSAAETPDGRRERRERALNAAAAKIDAENSRRRA
jgi:uncharacterized protein YdaU (DUF1376 family)